MTEPEDASETLCYACLSSGMRTALALNQSGVTHGMLTRRRTIMHASHVMAHSELVSNGHRGEEVLNDIRKSNQVAQIITEYYVRPQAVLARVDGLQ